jgi:hypothetical protein
LDGVLGDRFTGGKDSHRFRPATLEYASANFPRLIVEMKRNRLLLSRQSSVEDPETVVLYNPGKPENRWVVLGSDWDIIKRISDNCILTLFASDTDAVIEARIRAQVELAFAGRGVPK